MAAASAPKRSIGSCGEAFDGLLDFATLAHVCGPKRTDASLADRAGYHQFEYVGAQWGDLLAAADVVVSRAGANSLYELVALRKPHLLVPLPRSASRGDQISNAGYAQVARLEPRRAPKKNWTRRGSKPKCARSTPTARSSGGALEGAGLGDGTAAVADVICRYAKPA